MSVKVISGIAGSVTTIGSGIAIYLSNNTNNPPNLNKNSTKDLQQQTTKVKKTKTWQQITESSEYIAAQQTGKLLNLITYSFNDADVDESYFLIETTQHTPNTNFQNDTLLKEINIRVNNPIVLEYKISKKFSDLPFFCFNDENVSLIEELNFNNLKKCNANTKNKYMVIFLGKFDGTTETVEDFEEKFNEWQDAKVEFELIANNSETIKFEGKMLKIFHTGYKPNAT